MSQKFLVVTKKTVVDVPAQDEVLDDEGNVVTPAAAAQTHEEVDQTYIEEDAAQIAKNLVDDEKGIGRNYGYYAIQFNGATLQPTLHPVTLKSGPRAPAPTHEVAEIEANGEDLGAAVVEA